MAIDPKELAESGLLLVDKPVDWTSHDAVNCVRRRFGVRKVGHCGTLDPAATGLLVLVSGKATKLSGKLTVADKRYTGTMRLGIETDTLDSEGKIVSRGDISGISGEDVVRTAESFTGDILQIPPMVSAIKHEGTPLYKLARQGKTVKRNPRPVSIYSLEIHNVDLPDVNFSVHCSKGTYVRALCSDIGNKLGCGGYLLELRRTVSGDFKVDDAHTMEEIKTWEREDFLDALVPLGDVLVRFMNQGRP